MRVRYKAPCAIYASIKKSATHTAAQEDDAERAVRVGLEIVAAITVLKSSVPLQTRIGIATGLVVVGDLIGSGKRRNAELSARRQTSLRGCKGRRA